MSVKDHIYPIEILFDIPLPNGQSLPRSVGCYLVVGASVALVDAGVAGAWPQVENALCTNDIGADALGHLVFTHAHPDHIGAAPSIVKAVAPSTYAHSDAVCWIEDPETQKRERPVPGFDGLVEGPVAIDKRLSGGDVLDLGGLHLQVLATPGHADGHLALYCPEAEALFTGDALPEPNAMPIYTDLAATLCSIRTLQGVEAVQTMYSSWEAPIRGRGAIDARCAEALDWVKRIHDSVRTATAGSGERDLQILTRQVMEDLGLPPFAANPLTSRTIQAHLAHIEDKRVADMETGRKGSPS